MKLMVKGTQEEQLLFQLLGVTAMENEQNTQDVYGLLLGKDQRLADEELSQLYVRLPNVDHPLKETEELARLLGRAIGQGEVRL